MNEQGQTVRAMRRARQQLAPSEALDILKRQTYGVLALQGDDGYPYAVALNYAYAEGALYFHCAPTGHKIDAVRANPRASFCVVDRAEVMPEQFATDYRSVVVFGTIELIEGDEAKYEALRTFAGCLAPMTGSSPEQAMRACMERVAMLKLTIESITGKQSSNRL